MKLTAGVLTYDPAVDDFGASLKRLRESYQLTQAEMARRAVRGEDDGPTPQSLSNHISRVERGEEPNPSLEFLERAARGMGLTLADFFGQLDALRSGAPVPFNREGTADIRPESEAPQHHGPTAPVSASEFARLAELCFQAAESSHRLTIRGLLADLAYAFQNAALPGGQAPVVGRESAEGAEDHRRVG